MAVKRKTGPDIPGMSDGQLLTHLLGLAGMGSAAAQKTSRALLAAHGSLEQVLAQPKEELLAHPHLGEGPAAFLLLLPAMIRRYTSTAAEAPRPLGSREDLARMLTPYFEGQSTERVCAFLLGDELQLITAVTLAQGGRSSVSCSTYRLLELALNHRAKGVILVHNHPDGIPNFSKSDLASTHVLLQELELIGVPLVDHYLLAGEHIVSLRQYLDNLHSTDCLHLDLQARFSRGEIKNAPTPKTDPPT